MNQESLNELLMKGIIEEYRNFKRLCSSGIPFNSINNFSETETLFLYNKYKQHKKLKGDKK
jgi:hypothetical protein